MVIVFYFALGSLSQERNFIKRCRFYYYMTKLFHVSYLLYLLQYRNCIVVEGEMTIQCIVGLFHVEIVSKMATHVIGILN